MEVTRGMHHTSFAMDDASRVGEARRHAAELAFQAGMDDVQAGRVAIVVTELGTNLVYHAKSGVLLLGLNPARREIEVVAIDRGPGISDVARSMQDGFSTRGTAGQGLGAVKRLASQLDLHSVPGEGTLLVARLAADEGPAQDTASVIASGLSVPVRGEIVCGDAWAVAIDGDQAAVMVADGLGHGPDAAEASLAAMDSFAQDPFAEPARQISAAHGRLRPTRGAAVMVLRVDAAAGTIRSCGAGNVTARVVSGLSDRTLLSQHGTAGVQVRRPEEASMPWPPHAIVVLHTDGIETRWTPARMLPLLARDPALPAALLMRDHSRGRDDATVVVLRRSH